MRNVSKVYRLYKKPSDRLIEIFFKRKLHQLFYANKNISFALQHGETLGIIGLNGAGKSTLLKQIAGVIEPSSGQIIRRGKVTALLELGTGFNAEFSGRENIYFNATMLGLSQKEIQTIEKDVIDFSELHEFIDEPLKTYSSGMVMRLAFSIAIFAKPDILVVDEALSVGDAYFSAKCTQTLKDRKNERMSIIYVSHDLNSLKLLCDRLLLLHKGELIKEGDVESVINTYNLLIAQMSHEEKSMKVEQHSYGTHEAKIVDVQMMAGGVATTHFTSGEEIEIHLVVEAFEEIENYSIGILIRDRLAQDIFGTNTYYHNLSITMKAGERRKVVFSMSLDIGPGRYTLTAAIHRGAAHHQGCAHWVDRACEFEVAGIKGPFFVGVCHLHPKVFLV